MNDDASNPDRLDFPANWDVIRDDTPKPVTGGEEVDPTETPTAPSMLSLLAASWADTVTIVAVCTAALIGLVLSGHQVPTAALGWAAALGAAWWIAAAATLIVVRQGTPGMLLAGVVFSDPVPPRRVAAVVAAGAAQALLFGLPGLAGPRRSPLALAAASRLRSSAA
jgi:hypothetical protein